MEAVEPDFIHYARVVCRFVGYALLTLFVLAKELVVWLMSNPENVGCSNVDVRLRHKDVVTSHCDGVVRPTTAEFCFTGELCKSLVDKGGYVVQWACNENPVSSSDHVRVASGGNLCKYIFHVAVPKDYNDMENILVKCFAEADRLEMKSLAVPAIRSDVGVSSENACKCLASAIMKFDKTAPVNLRRIEVFVPHSHLFSNYNDAFLRLLQKRPKTPQKPAIKPAVAPKPAKQPKSIEESKPGVKRISKSHQTTDTKIQTSQLDKAPPVRDVRVVVKKGDITMTQCDGIVNPTDNFNFTGAVSKSLYAKCGETIVTQCRNKVTSRSKNVRVTFGGSLCDHIFHVSISTHADELEKTLMDCMKEADRRKVETLAIPAVGTGGKGMTAEAASKCLASAIKKFAETNLTLREIVVYVYESHMLPEYQRKLSPMVCGVSAAKTRSDPTVWRDVDWEKPQKIKLKQNSHEYRIVVTKFRASLDVNPIKVERIQNPTLWKQFVAHKKKVETKLGRRRVSHQLFHGSSEEACDQIWKEGFDRSFTEDNVLYGRGAYFATTAEYSGREKYARPDANGHKRMFLVEVITGKYCKGEKDTRTAPKQDDGSLYDSVVDRTNEPNIFVVFRDASAYPLYMLTYT